MEQIRHTVTVFFSHFLSLKKRRKHSMSSNCNFHVIFFKAQPFKLVVACNTVGNIQLLSIPWKGTRGFWVFLRLNTTWSSTCQLVSCQKHNLTTALTMISHSNYLINFRDELFDVHLYGESFLSCKCMVQSMVAHYFFWLTANFL